MGAERSGFKTAVLGFKRDDVLACIDRLAAESLQSKQKAEEQLAVLQGQVDELQSDREAMQDRLHKGTEVVVEATRRAAEQETRADAAEQSVGRLTKELAAALVSTKDYKKRLFEREEEAVILRRDNARLTETLEKKQHELDELRDALNAVRTDCRAEVAKAGAAADTACRKAQTEVECARRQAKAEAEAQAAAVLAAEKQRLCAEQVTAKRQMRQSADALSGELATVKRDLAAVEQRIAEVTANLQRSTQALSQVLEQTESNVERLSTKLRLFPEEPQSDVQGETTNTVPSPKREAPGEAAEAETAKPEKEAGRAGLTLSELLLEKLARMLEK